MMEPRGKGKAEVACRNALGMLATLRGWEEVQKTFEQYGNYLLLTGHDTPVGEVRVFTR